MSFSDAFLEVKKLAVATEEDDWEATAAEFVCGLDVADLADESTGGSDWTGEGFDGSDVVCTWRCHVVSETNCT